MSGEEMKAAIRAAAADWNAGDVDGFLSMFDSSLLHHGVTPEPLDAKGNRAFYEGMQASFPGSQMTRKRALRVRCAELAI